MIEFVIEEHPFGIFIVIALTACLLVFTLKHRRENAVAIKTVADAPDGLKKLIYKTVLFVVIVWLLSFLFNILALISSSTPAFITSWLAELKADGQTVNKGTIIYVWILFLLMSIFNLGLGSIIANLFTGVVFSSMYIYFNIQLSFAAIILLFFSFADFLNDSNFALSFIIISVAMGFGVVYFKLKTYLLNSIRSYFLAIHTTSSRTATKILEFYVVCAPYIIYSILFSVTTLLGDFNLFIQIAIAHVFCYYFIYKFYKEGHNISFDYDPF
jgi:hypothetical protein